jgi:hypothetical protein
MVLVDGVQGKVGGGINRAVYSKLVSGGKVEWRWRLLSRQNSLKPAGEGGY